MDAGKADRQRKRGAGRKRLCLPAAPRHMDKEISLKRLPRALCGRRVFAIERAGRVVRVCPNACREHGILPPHETVRFLRGSLDKPRGVQYAMHRHYPPGGCYAGVGRTSGGRGCSLGRADCPGGRIANAKARTRQVRESGHATEAHAWLENGAWGMSPKQASRKGRRIAETGMLSKQTHR